MPYFGPKGRRDEKEPTEISISLKVSPIHKYVHLKEKRNRWFV